MVCTVLATDSIICCYWLHPFLLGKGVFGPDFVFQSGLNVQSTLGQIQRLVSGQMAGLEVRKALHSSRGSIVVRGVSIEEPRAK